MFRPLIIVGNEAGNHQIQLGCGRLSGGILESGTILNEVFHSGQRQLDEPFEIRVRVDNQDIGHSPPTRSDNGQRLIIVRLSNRTSGMSARFGGGGVVKACLLSIAHWVSNQLLIQGIPNQFCGRFHSKLDKQTGTIGAHGFNAQVEVLGDFSQAPALGNPLEDLDLPV